MRESDRILSEDLRAEGLAHLAVRAERGEWNDFFGLHTMPQHHLIETLRDQVRMANVVRKKLIDNIVNGKYDATTAESQEWGESPEGRDILDQLSGGNPHP